MRVAYLILVHDRPNHFKRLVRALHSPKATFFVHVDRKSSITPFLLDMPNVTFLRDRIPIYWGDFSIVRATIRLIEAALPYAPDYCCLLSGSDYPIRTPEYIERFFEGNRDRQYMALVKIPCPERGKPLSRVEAYRFRIPHIHPFVARVVRRINKALPKRSYTGITPFGGSQWWALTGDVCQYILDYARAHSDFVEFFSRVPCPDESFFHVIVGNSAYREKVVRNLTFCDWSPNSSSPVMLTAKHIEMLAKPAPLVLHDDYYGSGELLFARKFPDDSEALLAPLRAK